MQFLIGLIPESWRLWAALIGIVLVVGLLVAAGDWIGSHRVQAKWDAETIAQQRIDDEALKDRQATALWWRDQLIGAMNERDKAEQDAIVARAAGDAAGQRLRDARSAFQRRLSDASVEACRTAASTVAALLDECSTRYRSVAAAADGHLADLKQCEAAWPK